MRKVLPVVALVGALVMAGCAANSAGPSTSSSPHAGAVQVFYAGSLVNLMKDVQPAFDGAANGSFQGQSAGSTALANEIKGKVKRADVFVSASTSTNDGLMGQANGNWESWYASFATAPLVIGYNPNSKFANDLKTKPWTEVINEPGFTMGSTDPKLDPKGALGAQALQQAGIPQSKVQIFPEEQLLARLASGNLDAGFFYSSEAADQKLPTVSLGTIHLAANYTISVLNNAPNPVGAQAFVNYLLGPSGKALLTKHGLTLTPITVAGNPTDVPSSLRSVLGLG